MAAPPSADGAHKVRRRVASDPIRGSTDELLDDVEGERARAGTPGVLHLDGVPVGIEVSQLHCVRKDAEHRRRECRASSGEFILRHDEGGRLPDS